jgi:hypothetical protein
MEIATTIIDIITARAGGADWGALIAIAAVGLVIGFLPHQPANLGAEHQDQRRQDDDREHD